MYTDLLGHMVNLERSAELHAMEHHASLDEERRVPRARTRRLFRLLAIRRHGQTSARPARALPATE